MGPIRKNATKKGINKNNNTSYFIATDHWFWPREE